jgi:hypothetical protein
MILSSLASVSVLALAVSAGSWMILGGILLYGLAGKWAADAVLSAWLGDHVATRFSGVANAMYGVNNTARMAANLTSPVLTGLLLDRTGTLATGFFVAAGALAGSALVAFFVAEGRPATLARTGALPEQRVFRAE